MDKSNENRNQILEGPEAPTNTTLIYVVDDDEGLTELYTIFLTGTGHVVRAFNSRTDALQALTTEDHAPDLLIMDFVGHAMPPHWFIQRCLLAHPELRILVATGLSNSDRLCPEVQPLRFLQKPFTARRFLEAVSAALAA
jgi:DNA-binding NtrC family response regulator